MLEFLTKKSSQDNFWEKNDLNNIFSQMKEYFGYYEIYEDRAKYLKDTIKQYGYLPYPHYHALNELTSGEIIYTLEQILIKEGSYNGYEFNNFKNPSPLARHNIKNSNWFKKEGHNIKMISLSALSNSEKTKEAGKFIDWLCELITLPCGNINEGLMPATIYLTPFHPRDFGCAYLPNSSDISPNIVDNKIKQFFDLDGKSQVKLFITLAQLSGHPVIYDILPQTARFSKMVLVNPYIARWFNINELINSISDFLNIVALNLSNHSDFNKDDIFKTRDLYIEILKGSKKEYDETQKKIVKKFEEELKEFKILTSYKMSFKEKQEEIVSQVEKIIEKTNGKKPLEEKDILCHEEIIKALTKEGFWPAPGGAWCSAGVPIFDKMNKYKEYPIFKHYNFKGEDVTHFANLDCQTPFYFVYFEKQGGKYNFKVIDFYLDYTKKLQAEYNFDGFRVDHVDHIVDEVSSKNDFAISYRIPSRVLGKVNSQIKKNIPYFATLAEYMLWDDFYREYHKDMNFDLLWGNDIVSQNSKTPRQIIEDNKKLEKYNKKYGSNNPLSICKTYNNQDGEFEAIDQYPGQLGEEGALLKWFKYKFIPGGALANRPTLFVDGDESFTKSGVERIIGAEVPMKRGTNWSFYEKFDAINRFVESSDLILNGKAELIKQDDDGFASWRIDKEGAKEAFLVVVNYLSPTEKFDVQQDDGSSKKVFKKGHEIYNKQIILNENEELVSYYDFDYDSNSKLVFSQKPLISPIQNEIDFEILFPSEFKVYKIIKK